MQAGFTHRMLPRKNTYNCLEECFHHMINVLFTDNVNIGQSVGTGTVPSTMPWLQNSEYSQVTLFITQNVRKHILAYSESTYPCQNQV